MISTQLRIKRYLPIFFSIFISTIFLSNCTRLPKPSIKNKTILVVKDEFVNTSKLPPQMRMKFNIKSSNGLVGNFYVMPSNGNAIISSLEPGNYNINGYTLHAVGTETPRKPQIYSFNTKFELKNNQITILNRKIVAVQKPYDSRGGWRFNVKTKSLTDSEKQEVINILRKDKNFSLWSLYVENNYVNKSNLDQNRFCTGSFFNAANNENTVKSYKKFLDYCSDKNSYWYLTATRELEELQKQKDPEPEPEPKPEPKPDSDYSSVVLPKVTASPPKVSDQSERPETIIIPVSGIGDVSNTRKLILENTLTDELKKHFRIVPQEKYEQVLEQVFKELEYEECSVDTCIMRVQEMLQVENVFNLQIIGEGKDSQLNLKWITLDEKKNETDVCLGCGTFQLNDKVRGLVEKLVGR